MPLLRFFSLTALFIGACADTYYLYPPMPQNSAATAVKSGTVAVKTQTLAAKTQAIINFSGKVTLKKTNDLTAYIHQQMNEGVLEFIININSRGGDSDAAIAAYEYLKQLPVNITTHNIGNVQSSAVLLYCSGLNRYALPHAFFMLHGSSTTYSESLSLSEIEALLKLGKIHQQAFVDIFKSCANLDKATLESYFSSADAHYLTAAEARDIGLVQQISPPPFLKTAVFYNITD